MNNLCEFLYAHFGIKPIVLTDECDTGVNKVYRNLNKADKIIELHIL